MIDIITAIVALDSTAQVSVHGEEVIWHDGNPNGITVEQITAKQAELQTAYDDVAYQRKRIYEYPRVEEQLDMLWHAMDDGILTKVDAFYDANKAVKDKYPKGN